MFFYDSPTGQKDKALGTICLQKKGTRLMEKGEWLSDHFVRKTDLLAETYCWDSNE